MRKFFKLSLLILSLLFKISLSGFGQSFSATYSFASVTTSSGLTDPTAVPTATGATFGSFAAVGQTTTNPNATGRFSFTGQPTGATTGSDIFTGSISTTQYYEVTITPAAGYSLDLNSITFTLQRSGTGIRQYAVRSSLDFNTNLPASISPANTDLSVVATNIFQVSDATTSAETGSTITLGAAYDALTSPVFFRFYGWNAEAGTGTFSIDDVVINGIATNVTATPTVNLSVSSNSGSEAGATVITVTATASQAVSGDQTVDLAVSGTNITSGDYNLSNAVITILNGQTTGTSTFTIADDSDVEGNETATLTISNPTAGLVLGVTTNQNISITDNDVSTVSVSAGLNASEPATPGTFGITLSNAAPAGGVTINYTLSGTATSNTDYSDAPLNGSITISEGNSTGTITLNVNNDPDYEGTETINILLNNASNGYAIGTSTASINLLDDDPLPSIVINEVYGGGGNNGSLYKNDFIELYNNSNSPVSLAGWSIQYNSAAGTGSWQLTNLSGTIPAHGYYLVQEAVGAGGTANLPTPDATGTISMAAGAGKVALVNNTTALVGQNPLSVAIVDKVAYGSVTGGGFEGAGSATAPSATNSIQRTPIGSDTNDNFADFTSITPPTPKNSVTDIIAPAIAALSPINTSINNPIAFTAVLTFNENVEKLTGNIVLKKTDDNSIVKTINVAGTDVTVGGANVSFLIQGLAYNTSYYFEVSNGAFRDLSENPFAGFSGSSTWSFTTSAMPVGIVGNTYNFNVCTSLPDGFEFYSEVGPQLWSCTSFGRNAADLPLGSAPNGVQINGFSGTNIPNVDWLISPSFDLTGTTYPLLSFWSRTAFNGEPLELKVSMDYAGGDPSSATWVDINGKFPGETSNAWTLSEFINLSAFKGTNVHFAYVYHSSDDDGARWTLDDITLANSLVAPPPSLTVGTTAIQFPYTSAGNTNDKTFTFIGNDLTNDITLNATGPFTLSKDGGIFSSSLVYTVAEANNVFKTVHVRFAPPVNKQNFTGNINIVTGSLSSDVNLSGTSVDPATTLEVVNWNIEWFGSTINGPTNDAQQEQNVKTVLQNLNADIYAVSEIVSETRLASVVSQMPGYTYVISNYGSHTNTTANPPSALAEAQKLAFIYRTDIFTNVTTTPLLSQGINSAADLTNPAYNYWASGRFPFMLSADVTLNCVTKNVKFILVHGKANTAPTLASYDRRKKGADSLHYTLQQNYPNDNIIILGDYNDDLDVTITDGVVPNTTSYSAFTEDPANFTPLTLPLSLAGKRSTVSHDNVIDHVTSSNEMVATYMSGTANILTDVTGIVSNYGSSTSDHYPVFTRYIFENNVAPQVTNCTATVSHCQNGTNTYTIPAFVATDDCADVLKYRYDITGATTRSGISSNASGTFNAGVSTIVWTAIDGWGNTATCQTTVTINANPTVTIPDAHALPSGTLANTVYIGYSPASSINLTASASGGAPGYTYSWSTGPTSSSISVSPVVNTTYTVTITDQNSCQASASKQIVVMDIRGGKKLDKVMVCHNQSGVPNTLVVDASETAIHLSHGDMLGACGTAGIITKSSIEKENIEMRKLAIVAMPNPSAKGFMLNVTGDAASQLMLRVIDISGRIIEVKNVTPNQSFRIGDNYRAGMYFAEIIQGNERKIVKLVKLE